MGKKLRIRLQCFWEKYKADIIATAAAIAFTVGVGSIVGYYNNKAEEQKEAERAAKEAEEAENRRKAHEEYMAELEEKKNDLMNQFPGGGWVVEDYMYEPDMPCVDVNDVPVDSLGEFGQEFKRRYLEEFPDWEEIGMMNPDKLLVSIDICAEHVYLDDEKKEEEAA